MLKKGEECCRLLSLILCLCVPFLWWSLQFMVRVLPFLYFVFVCAFPMVISSIYGKSFPVPFPYCVFVCAFPMVISTIYGKSFPVPFPYCVFACAFPMVISSIYGKCFPIPFPYFVLFVLRYFPFHTVKIQIDKETLVRGQTSSSWAQVPKSL